jgi:hypothetical protein
MDKLTLTLLSENITFDNETLENFKECIRITETYDEIYNSTLKMILEEETTPTSVDNQQAKKDQQAATKDNIIQKSLNAFLQRISVIAQKIKSLTGKAKLPFLITYRGLVNKYYNLVITRMKNKNSQDPQIKVKEEELKAKLSNIDEKINIAKGKVETTSDTTKTNPTQNNVQSKAPTVPTPASV